MTHEILKNIDLFKDYNDKDFGTIIKYLNGKNYGDGAVICKEGEPGLDMFFLTSGKVRISREITEGISENLGEINAPSALGMISLIDKGMRSATVKAVGAVEGFTLKKNDFDELLKKSDMASCKLLYNIVIRLSFQLRQANNKLSEIYSRPLETLEKLKKVHLAILKDIEETPPEFVVFEGQKRDNKPIR